MQVRRVVTGHSPDGKAIVASDTQVDGITSVMMGEWEFHRLWGADQVPTFPDNGEPRLATTYFPPLGGFRFGIFTVPPQSVAPSESFDIETALQEVEEKLPGMTAHMKFDNPGMHTTDTVDFEYVLSGEVWLELDDGAEVHLFPGDTVVQSGTRHAWRNKGSETCRMVLCMIGAHRKLK